MHCYSCDIVRFCMRSECSGCCQNKQDGRSEKENRASFFFANFLEQWLHYKVNNHPVAKNKPIYHAWNVKSMKELGGTSLTSPFHRFTNPQSDKSVYFWSWDSYLLFTVTFVTDLFLLAVHLVLVIHPLPSLQALLGGHWTLPHPSYLWDLADQGYRVHLQNNMKLCSMKS